MRRRLCDSGRIANLLVLSSFPQAHLFFDVEPEVEAVGWDPDDSPRPEFSVFDSPFVRVDRCGGCFALRGVVDPGGNGGAVVGGGGIVGRGFVGTCLGRCAVGGGDASPQ